MRFPIELTAIDRGSPDPKRRCFSEDNAFQSRSVGRIAKHAQHHAGPILFHLNRRRENIERAGFKQLRHAISNQLAGNIV